MTTEVIPYRFLCRGGTAANLAAVNEVPLARELVIETDTLKMKCGDGVTHYNDLEYVVGSVHGPMGFGVSNDGGIVAGVKRIVRVADPTVIHAWAMSADAAGSAEVQLWASAAYPPTAADKITAAAPPTLAAQSAAAGSASTWLAIPANSWLAFAVVSAIGVSRLDLTMQMTRIPQ